MQGFSMIVYISVTHVHCTYNGRSDICLNVGYLSMCVCMRPTCTVNVSLSLPLSSPSSSAAPVTSLAADATPSTTSRTESFVPTGNHRPTSDALSPPLTQGQHKTLPCTISDTERGCGSIIRASYLISVALYYRSNTERGCGSANIRKSY